MIFPPSALAPFFRPHWKSNTQNQRVLSPSASIFAAVFWLPLDHQRLLTPPSCAPLISGSNAPASLNHVAEATHTQVKGGGNEAAQTSSDQHLIGSPQRPCLGTHSAGDQRGELKDCVEAPTRKDKRQQTEERVGIVTVCVHDVANTSGRQRNLDKRTSQFTLDLEVGRASAPRCQAILWACRWPSLCAPVGLLQVAQLSSWQALRPRGLIKLENCNLTFHSSVFASPLFEEKTDWIFLLV